MDADDQSSSRIGALRVSARGWHGVQLAVLGFIGLCGVLQRDAASGKPHWLQVLAGLLVLVAFGMACLATVLVALAAWPVYAPRPRTVDDDAEINSTSGRLRAGITLTYVAVAILALSTSSAWWPGETSEGVERSAVEVVTRAGQICGGLDSSTQRGALTISAEGRVVQIALSDVVSMRPVPAC
jgi:hypothetical protein